MSGDILIKFLVAAVLAGTPFLFGTVGEILSEKVGHLNLGVEGMMSLGACAGFMAGYLSDNFLGAILASAAAGVRRADLRSSDRYLYGKPECYRSYHDDFRRRAFQFYRRVYAGALRGRDAKASGDNHGSDEKY